MILRFYPRHLHAVSLVLLAAGLGAHGCVDEADDPAGAGPGAADASTADRTDAGTGPEAPKLVGTVLSGNGEGFDIVPGARVRLEGSAALAAETDDRGRFVFADPPVDVPLRLVVEGPDADTALPAEPFGTNEVTVVVDRIEGRSVVVYLLRGCTALVSATGGGEVREDACAGAGGIELDFAPGAFETEAGTFAGQVEVQMTSPAPDVPSDLLGLPDDGRGALGPRVFGAMEVRLRDAATLAPLELAPGSRATIRMELSELAEGLDEEALAFEFWDEDAGAYADPRTTWARRTWITSRADAVVDVGRPSIPCREIQVWQPRFPQPVGFFCDYELRADGSLARECSSTDPDVRRVSILEATCGHQCRSQIDRHYGLPGWTTRSSNTSNPASGPPNLFIENDLDAFGNVTREVRTVVDGQGQSQTTIHVSYDRADRPTRVERRRDDGGAPGVLFETEAVQYVGGRLEQVEVDSQADGVPDYATEYFEENGRRTRIETEAAGRRLGTTTLGYDALGRLDYVEDEVQGEVTYRTDYTYCP